MGVHVFEFLNDAGDGNRFSHVVKNTRAMVSPHQARRARNQKQHTGLQINSIHVIHSFGVRLTKTYLAFVAPPAGFLISSLYVASSDGTQTSSRIRVLSSARVSVILSLTHGLV